MNKWIAENIETLQEYCANHTPIAIVFNDEPDYILDCIPIETNGFDCKVIVDEYDNRYGLRPGMEVYVETEEIGDVIVRAKPTVPPEDYQPETEEEVERNKAAFSQAVFKAMDEGKFHAWALFIDPTEDEELKQIQHIMLHMDAFLRDDETGFADTHMQISNNPNGTEPVWHRTEDGYSITLCAESGKHWCQVAFQLGYTMMHCLIDHLNPFEDHRIDWVEELICEMASRQLLYLLCKNWENNPLSNIDPDYGGFIWDYIEESFDFGSARLSSCSSIEDLEKINTYGNGEISSRAEEVYNLYHMCSNDDLLRLAHCRKYAKPGTVLLDTNKWREDEPYSQSVAYICRLQDRIPDITTNA